jgi:peptide/nickel transport system substrate-binding protein
VIRRVLLIGIAVCTVACASASPSRPPGEVSTTAQSPTPGRTLVVVTRGEPDSLARKTIFRATGLSIHATAMLFNAELTLIDDTASPRPYLAEAIPQLNTDSWRVFPDGRMETTYRLRDGITWHDGTPLTSQDFIFAWKVFSTPSIGAAGLVPISVMEDVLSADDRTIVIRWKQPYPDADRIGAAEREFPPLPRHILEAPFVQDQGEAFGRLSYWTTDYMGLGTFRLDQWVPGSHIEASAFGGHILGKVKIDRLRILFLADFNTTLANILSGEAHIAIDDSLRSNEAAVLKQSWQPTNGGSVVVVPGQWRRSEPQLRPEYATPRAITDVRARRALAHAVDRAALAEALFGADGLPADSFIVPGPAYYQELDRTISKYPYDPRTSEALMGQVGWTRGPDGIFVHPEQGRFTSELKANASSQSDRETLIVTASLQAAGFDLRPVSVPPAQSRLGEVRATFPTLYSGNGTVGERALLNLPSTQIPTAENRWVGSNRAGWASAEYDRLFDAYSSTLDRQERDRQVIGMLKVYTEDVGAISLFYDLKVVPHVSALVGPRDYAPETQVTWNAFEWAWR